MSPPDTDALARQAQINYLETVKTGSLIRHAVALLIEACKGDVEEAVRSAHMLVDAWGEDIQDGIQEHLKTMREKSKKTPVS